MIYFPLRKHSSSTVLLCFSAHDFLVVLVNVRVDKYFPRRAFLYFLLSLLKSSADCSVFVFPVGLALEAGVNNGTELALLDFENIAMLWHSSRLFTQTIILILLAKVIIIEVVQLVAIVFVSRENKALAWLYVIEASQWIILPAQHRVILRALISEGCSTLQGLVIGSMHVATRVIISFLYRFQYQCADLT